MAIKYKWIADQLELFIEKEIQKGLAKLPAEKDLCKKYHVSRQTIRMALSILEQKGLIARRQGSGSYITGRLPRPYGDVVGVMVSSPQDYIYPGVLEDIRSTLSHSGFSTMVFQTDNSVYKEREILAQLVKNPPRGMIVEGCKSALPNPNLDLYYKLSQKGCPVVFLYNYYPALPNCLYVKDDNFGGSALLTEHLASQGHTSIGGIFKSDDMQGLERYQGYVETLRGLGLSFSDKRICWYDSKDLEQLHQAEDTSFLQQMLEESLSSCSAVVCYNDIIAFYLIDELQKAGYRLPQDMAITAFDNTYLSNANVVTVTTLSHKHHEMGTRAAQTLLDKIKGLPALSQEVPWKLNQKESTRTEIS